MDGHDVTACMLNLSSKFQGDAAPGMIISNTIKGNGIPSLQNTPKSHHTLPKDVEAVRTNLS
jgi:transketolase